MKPGLLPPDARPSLSGAAKPAAPAEEESLIPGFVEPGARSLPQEANADTAGDWLCAWCHNRVARDKDRFPYDGKDEFTFYNPEKTRFDIITFVRVLGCHAAGPTTLEHTWFPGHAWSFCQCDRCHQQLGWFYAGKHQFAGLIKARIVRAFVNN